MLGYKLIKYHQIWNFEEKSQYDPIAKTGGLFTDYVNFNLKGKTEASGFPADCPSDILKDEFIKEFENKEGVKLDKANIAKNPGVRNEKKAKLNYQLADCFSKLYMKKFICTIKYIINGSRSLFKLLSSFSKLFKYRQNSCCLYSLEVFTLHSIQTLKKQKIKTNSYVIVMYMFINKKRKN